MAGLTRKWTFGVESLGCGRDIDVLIGKPAAVLPHQPHDSHARPPGCGCGRAELVEHIADVLDHIEDHDELPMDITRVDASRPSAHVRQT
jgi:hypothetical protein